MLAFTMRTASVLTPILLASGPCLAFDSFPQPAQTWPSWQQKTAMITPPPEPRLVRRAFPEVQTLHICSSGSKCHDFTITRPPNINTKLAHPHHGEDPDFDISAKPYFFPPSLSVDVDQEVTSVSLQTVTQYHTLPATTLSDGTKVAMAVIAEIAVVVVGYGLLKPVPIEIPIDGTDGEEWENPNEPDPEKETWSKIKTTTSSGKPDSSVCTKNTVEWNTEFMSKFNSQVTSLGTSGLSSLFSRPSVFGQPDKPPTTTPKDPPTTTTPPVHSTSHIICNINSGPPDTGGSDNWNRGHTKDNIDYLIKLGDKDCPVAAKGYGEFSCSYGESVDVANDSNHPINLKCGDIGNWAMKLYNACPGQGSLSMEDWTIWITTRDC